jgi:hypothetical protein
MELRAEDFPYFLHEQPYGMKSGSGGVPSRLPEPCRRMGGENSCCDGAYPAWATSNTDTTDPPSDFGTQATQQQIPTTLTRME